MTVDLTWRVGFLDGTERLFRGMPKAIGPEIVGFGPTVAHTHNIPEACFFTKNAKYMERENEMDWSDGAWSVPVPLAFRK